MVFLAAIVLSGTAFGFSIAPATDMTDSSWWEYKTVKDGVSVQIDRHPDYVKFDLIDEAGEYGWGNVARNNQNSIGILATVTIDSISGDYGSAGVIHYEIGQHNGNKVYAMIGVAARSTNNTYRVEAQVFERQPDGSGLRLAMFFFPDLDASALGAPITVGLCRLENAVYFYQAGVEAFLIYQPHFDLGAIGNDSGSGVYTNTGSNSAIESTISNVLLILE